jgi:predicted DNA-binding transcriptional regulator AlpA
MGKAKTIVSPKTPIIPRTRDVGGPPTIPAVVTANLVAMKARQCAKIGELREALLDAGLMSLDQQAAALGLSRSTAWALLKSTHKASGLSASTIRRMLNSPALPPKARRVVEDYVERKSSGTYGHREHRLRMFRARLNLKPGLATSECHNVQNGSGNLIQANKYQG